MYAMSWERNTQDYKYESIQHGYEVLDTYDENENDEQDLSLDEMIENEIEFDEFEELI